MSERDEQMRFPDRRNRLARPMRVRLPQDEIDKQPKNERKPFTTVHLYVGPTKVARA